MSVRNPETSRHKQTDGNTDGRKQKRTGRDGFHKREDKNEHQKQGAMEQGKNVTYGLTLTLNLDVIMHFIDYLQPAKGSVFNPAKGK